MNAKDNWNECYKAGRMFAAVSEIVLDNLSLSGKRALDIGCGEGRLMKQLEARGFEVDGIDLSDASAGIVGDFMTYDFGDNKYDLITANLVIAFMPDKKAFVKKAISLLTKNGRLIIITPVMYDEYTYTDRESSIAVNFTELQGLSKDVKIYDTNYGEGYTCRLTVELL